MRTPWCLRLCATLWIVLGKNATCSRLDQEEACSLRCRQWDTATRQTDPSPIAQLPVRVFYFITVHNNRTVHDAIQLLPVLRDPSHTILIHADAKTPLQAVATLQSAVQTCPCGTLLASQRFNVSWSHWSMNIPTLWALEQAVLQETNEWDVFINLSGDSWPVFHVEATAQRLSRLTPYYNFVTSSSCATGLRPTSVYEFPTFWHKREHYTRKETEPDFEYGNVTVPTYFGSQWMILRRDFCEWLSEALTKVDHRDAWVSHYRDYLRDSGKLMTDETFIPSVIMASRWKHTVPHDRGLNQDSSLLKSIQHVRYERMDEHLPTAAGNFAETQHYTVPNSSQTVDLPKPWGPYFLGVYDLSAIRDSGALFIRKVTAGVDPNLLRLLPVSTSSEIPDISWPSHALALIEKPDWSVDTQQMYREIFLNDEKKRRLAEAPHGGEF